MSEQAETSGERAIVYCVVPRDLAARLHEPLRRHFRDDPGVEVIVERRDGDRRGASDRRARRTDSRRVDRRTIRNTEGRRVGERRAPLVEVELDRSALPRRARAHADRLRLVERLEPLGEHLEDLDTARLVTRIQAGDRDAFSDLYLRYFDRVYAYLKIALDDLHEAEDATQQVFVKVLEGLPRYERRGRPFRAWLFIVVRNHALDRLEEKHRLDLVDPLELRRDRPGAGGAEMETLDWLTDRDLVIFVERLPRPQRQVLVLRYMLDLSVAEIAAILDRKPNDVSVLHHRALAFLRDRLTAIGRAPEGRGRPRMRRFIKPAPVLRARRFSL